MQVKEQIEAVAAKLDSYHEQMAAVSKALGALRELADAIIGEMAADSTLLRACDAADATANTDGIEGTEATADLAKAAVPATAGLDPIAVDPDDNALIGMEISSDIDTPTDEDVAVATAVVEEAATVRTPPPLPATFELALDPTEAAMVQAKIETGLAIAAALAQSAPEKACNIIELESHRKASIRPTTLRRRAIGVAASLMLITSATAAVHGILGTEIGQRLLDLSVCDADMLSANRDCAMLSWMLL